MRNTEKLKKNKHCLTWNMAINIQNMENEKGTLQELQYGKKTENHGNEKHTLQDLKYGKNKTMKNLENEEQTLQDLEYGEKTDQKGK